MSQYFVPPDTNEKEKIVGGVLTGGQLIWILIGLGLGAGFAFITFPLFGNTSIILGLFFLPIGLVFAFAKKKGLPLYEYLTRRRKHKKKTKKLPNLRIEGNRDVQK